MVVNFSDSQSKFQVIFTNTCQSSQYSTVKTAKDSISGPSVIIVKLENTYDVIFHQSTIAPVNYFRWTFDHNGTALQSSPEPLVKLFPEVKKFSHIASIFPLCHNSGEDYVFIGKGIDNRNVYCTLSGWLTAEKIYYSDHSFSNSSGYANICWKLKLKPGSNEIRCKCLGKTCPYNDYVLTVRNHIYHHHFEEFSIHNNAEGRVLLLSEMFNMTNGKALLVVDETQSDGKCRRVALLELPGNLDRIELSITDRRGYCFFFVTHSFSLARPRSRLNRFSSQCFQIPFFKIISWIGVSQNDVACTAID